MKSIFFASMASLVTMSSAHATVFTNGTFDTDLSGWNNASSTGTVTHSNSQAVLSTGDGADLFSAIMVQGDDGFFFFTSPISLVSDITTLTFDAVFSSLGTDSLENGGATFGDYLLIALYDADDWTGSGDLFFDLDLGSTSQSFDVSSLAGHNIALSFELTDEDDGFNSEVTIDNIAFSSPGTVVNINEPASLTLLGLGLFGVLYRKKIKKCINIKQY